MKYILYYDSGTSCTRGYLLDENLNLAVHALRRTGVKDCAAAGSNQPLVEALCSLREELLEAAAAEKEEVQAVFLSGMAGNPLGLLEVPHVILPVTAEGYLSRAAKYYSKAFDQPLWVIPGLKTEGNSLAEVGNVRGEEVELFGLLPEVKNRMGDTCAVMLPGSHTHTFFLRSGQVEGILSTLTGELFHAVSRATILADVMKTPLEIDKEAVHRGVEDLKRYGINRALYICHAMNVFHEGSDKTRFGYGEGVILGGICQALEKYCEDNGWAHLDIAVAADAGICELYKALLDRCQYVDRIVSFPTVGDPPAVKGLRLLLKDGIPQPMKKGEGEE